jgi:lipopolysaccharide transport protein LptA
VKTLQILLMVGVLLWLEGYGQSQAPLSGIGKLLPQKCQGDTAALDITADRMTFDQQTRMFTFEDNVRIQQCGMIILCDRLQITNDIKGENVERIVATGNVHLQQGTRHIKAKRVVYFADEQRLVFTGTPRAWDTQEQHEMTGEEITIFLQQERVLVKHARVLFHPRKTSTRKP